jgi:CRISPR-associated endonuclease/helicase Cas3
MNATESYHQLCNFYPTTEQEEAFDVLINGGSSKNPLVLRLPCGYGKTESVVIPFLSQAFSGKWSLAPRLIYVLPTRALCNQIAERIETYASRVESISGRKLKVSIEHGISSQDPLFFADICVTTLDQFLYGYARTKAHIGKHVDMPAGAFANSIVVFDEAHLYSPYTHALLKAMLDILCYSNVPVVVMTATMPKTLHEDLLKDLKSLHIEFKGKFLCERELSWEMKEWRLLDGDKASESLIDFLNSAKDRKILIVANRVDVAQKLAIDKRLRDDGVKLIHSRFSVKDRGDKEKAVIDLLGKGSKGQNGIVISTQVCEVGLDISADILITECASADALVQRIGRVARWGGSGEVLIIKPVPGSDDKGGKEKFYPYVDEKLGEKGDFVKLADEYLRSHHDLDFTSWDSVTKFCDQMEYRVGYVEARNAMGQLFEATLYADSVPYTLSARNELYCTVFIGTVPNPKKKKSSELGTSISINESEFKVTDQIHYGEIKQSCLNVSYLWFRRFWRDGKGLKIVEYDPKTQMIKENTWNKRPLPFKIYALVDDKDAKEADKNYDSYIGLIPKAQELIEEACMIC